MSLEAIGVLLTAAGMVMGLITLFWRQITTARQVAERQAEMARQISLHQNEVSSSIAKDTNQWVGRITEIVRAQGEMLERLTRLIDEHQKSIASHSALINDLVLRMTRQERRD